MYEMVLNNRNVTNTWVFTEKDMPGFDGKAKVVQDPNMPAMPARLLYGDRDKKSFAERQKGNFNKNQKREPYMRKAIPSK